MESSHKIILIRNYMYTRLYSNPIQTEHIISIVPAHHRITILPWQSSKSNQWDREDRNEEGQRGADSISIEISEFLDGN